MPFLPPRRCLRVLDVVLLLCCAALCGGALYCTHSVLLDNIGPTVVYAAAGVSGAIFAATIVGLLSILGENVKPGALLTVRDCPPHKHCRERGAGSAAPGVQRRERGV